MDKIIDSRFERVEKALQTLITSISTYNPTPAHATDLLTADAELNQGLEQLSIHQRNHEKLLSLRATSTALDTQIRETLTLLTETRRALLSTPATVFPEATNPVSYTELLNYARRISKTTLPGTYREALEIGGTSTPPKDKSEPHTNGNTTPVLATNGSNGLDLKSPLNNDAMEIDTGTPQGTPLNTQLQTQPSQPSQEPSTTALPQDWQKFLNPITEEAFLPWPAEQDIRRGALASIQILVSAGVDPWTFDPELSGELEAERKRIEEEDERVKAEVVAKGEEERRREQERRVSVAAAAGTGQGGERKEEAPKVFQLETFDDDDDSE